MAVPWDPRSYLAEAAAAHVASIDATATATTIVDYYDSVTAHLRTSDTHRAVAAAVEGDAAPQPGLCVIAGVATAVPYRVLLPALMDDDRTTAERLVEEAFALCDRTFRPDLLGGVTLTDLAGALPEVDAPSELQAINRLPAGRPLHVSPPMALVLAAAQALHLATDGALDPTVARVAAVWRASLAKGSMPDDDDGAAALLREAQPCVGFELLGFDVASGTVTKAHDGVVLDLCGVAKGWLVDHLFASLQAALPQHAASLLVDWGGDIRCGGLHPVRRAPWRVGFVLPPKLKPLFDAWRIGSPLDPVLHHVVEAPPEGCAVATSGDYAQLQRWGHIHVYHATERRPLKVQNYTVAGAAILAPSCLAADGLATAALLCRTPARALELIMRVRAAHGVAPDGSFTGGLEVHPAAAASLALAVQRYYLYERNHATFLHDEADAAIGAGDAERLAGCDRAAAQDATLQTVVAAATLGGELHPTAARRPTDPAVLGLERARQSLSGAAPPAPVPTPGDEEERDAVATQLRRVLRAQPARLAVVVCGVAGLGGGSAAVPRAVLLSSFVDASCGCFPPSEARPVSFNVMRGSALFNHLRSPGALCVVHPLTTRHAGAADALTARPATWLSSVTAAGFTLAQGTAFPPLPPPALDADDGAAPVVVGIADIAQEALVCRVRRVVDVGDHLLVVADALPGVSVEDPTAQPPVPEDAASVPRGLALVLSERRAVSPSVVCPALLYATHSAFGQVAVPVLGLRMCAAAPGPRVSAAVWCSGVSKALLDPKLVRRDRCRLALLDGDDDHFRRDAASSGPWAAAAQFAYVPFPAFRPTPNLWCDVAASILHVAPSAEAPAWGDPKQQPPPPGAPAVLWVVLEASGVSPASPQAEYLAAAGDVLRRGQTGFEVLCYGDNGAHLPP